MTILLAQTKQIIRIANLVEMEIAEILKAELELSVGTLHEHIEKNLLKIRRSSVTVEYAVIQHVENVTKHENTLVDVLALKVA